MQKKMLDHETSQLAVRNFQKLSVEKEEGILDQADLGQMPRRHLQRFEEDTKVKEDGESPDNAVADAAEGATTNLQQLSLADHDDEGSEVYNYTLPPEGEGIGYASRAAMIDGNEPSAGLRDDQSLGQSSAADSLPSLSSINYESVATENCTADRSTASHGSDDSNTGSLWSAPMTQTPYVERKVESKKDSGIDPFLDKKPPAGGSFEGQTIEYITPVVTERKMPPIQTPSRWGSNRGLGASTDGGQGDDTGGPGTGGRTANALDTSSARQSRMVAPPPRPSRGGSAPPIRPSREPVSPARSPSRATTGAPQLRPSRTVTSLDANTAIRPSIPLDHNAPPPLDTYVSLSPAAAVGTVAGVASMPPTSATRNRGVHHRPQEQREHHSGQEDVIPSAPRRRYYPSRRARLKNDRSSSSEEGSSDGNNDY